MAKTFAVDTMPVNLLRQAYIDISGEEIVETSLDQIHIDAIIFGFHAADILFVSQAEPGDPWQDVTPEGLTGNEIITILEDGTLRCVVKLSTLN